MLCLVCHAKSSWPDRVSATDTRCGGRAAPRPFGEACWWGDMCRAVVAARLGAQRERQRSLVCVLGFGLGRRNKAREANHRHGRSIASVSPPVRAVRQSALPCPALPRCSVKPFPVSPHTHTHAHRPGGRGPVPSPFPLSLSPPPQLPRRVRIFLVPRPDPPPPARHPRGCPPRFSPRRAVSSMEGIDWYCAYGICALGIGGPGNGGIVAACVSNSQPAALGVSQARRGRVCTKRVV